MIIDKLHQIERAAGENISRFIPESEHSAKWTMLAFAALLSYCLWWLFRGFEITDEAYYLLQAQQPDATTLYLSAQQWVMGPIWELAKTQTLYRAAGFALLVLSSTFVVGGSLRLWKELYPDVIISAQSRAMAYICTISAALLYGFAINFSPCYNIIASAGAYTAFGAALYAITMRKNVLLYTAFLILSGLAISIEFLAKASAGICTLALIVATIAVFSSSYKLTLYAFCILIISSALGGLGILLANTTIDAAQESLTQGLALFKVVQSETTVGRLLRYTFEYIIHICFMMVIFALPLLMGALYYSRRNPVYVVAGFLILIITFLTGSYIFGVGSNSYYSIIGKYESQIRGLMIVLLGALAFSWTSLEKKWKPITLFIVLFSLPYTVAIGTGNQLFTQVLGSAATWGMLISLFLLASAQSIDLHKKSVSLLCALFVTLISAQVISGGLRSPYNLDGSILDHKNPVTIGSIGTVKVDDGTKTFIADINKAIETCKIPPKSDVFALYNIPGVVLAMDGIAPFSPWINNVEQAEKIMEINEDYAARLKNATLAIQLLEKGDMPKLPPSIGQDFDKNYHLCGEAVYPYRDQTIQIWARKNG